MAALLVAMSVMAVMMTGAAVWNTAAKRQKEAELVFRGELSTARDRAHQRKLRTPCRQA
jgi:hypothetical protein